MSEYAEPLSQAQLVREMTYARDSGVEIVQGEWLRALPHPQPGEPICRACLVGVLIWQRAGVTDWRDAQVNPAVESDYFGPLRVAVRLTGLSSEVLNAYSNAYEDARAGRFGPFTGTPITTYAAAYNAAYAATVEVFGDARSE